MTQTSLSFQILVLILWLMVPGFLSGQTSTQDIRVELMASNVSWIESEYTGHAFMCIVIRTNSGLKEDCYGFYPKGNSKGFIGGQGLVQSEFQKNPSRFSRIGISIRKPISESQRQEILRLVNYWNTQDYALTNQNCIDFVDSVAKEIYPRLPLRGSTELPITYLKKLQHENEVKASIPGNWSGKITTDNGAYSFDFSIVFKFENGILIGRLTIDSDAGNCDNLQVNLDRSILFSAGSGLDKMSFTGKFDADVRSMTGTFASALGNGKWTITKQ